MRNLRIIVVEDVELWQGILERHITKALENITDKEYTLEIIPTFAKAYQYLEKRDWDLLVTDIELIDSSSAKKQNLGIQLLGIAHSKHIPTIVVSGTATVKTHDVRNLFKKYHVCDYFSKSQFDYQEFIEEVKTVLQQQLSSSTKNSISLREDSDIKILFLASDPSDAPRLRLGQEFRDIEAKLQRSKNRDKFQLKQLMSVGVDDFTQAIMDVQPQILHFSGHGTNTGELCFEDPLGNMHPVKAEALAKLFENLPRSINCVILNACHSRIQAEMIANHIPFVIGMNQEITDQASTRFAVAFYKALGANYSFDAAYKFACAEIDLMLDTPENLVPVLYQKHPHRYFN